MGIARLVGKIMECLPLNLALFAFNLESFPWQFKDDFDKLKSHYWYCSDFGSHRTLEHTHRVELSSWLVLMVFYTVYERNVFRQNSKGSEIIVLGHNNA